MSTSISATRKDELRSEFATTLDSLKRRRADLVSESLIEEYVALYWLEWNGGTLQLTETGRNVRDQTRPAPTPEPTD